MWTRNQKLARILVPKLTSMTRKLVPEPHQPKREWLELLRESGLIKKLCCYLKVCYTIIFFNRSWHKSTTPNTTKFFLIIFKLIQQSNMVILSCPAKKNQNLNLRKKKFSLLLKREVCGRFWLENAIFSN